MPLVNWEYVRNLKDMVLTYYKVPVRHSKEKFMENTKNIRKTGKHDIRIKI
jgi:dihydropteroate synthase